MSDLSEIDCLCCGDETPERVRYFPRQLLTADDMRAEQDYLRTKRRRHNRYLHGWGVVCGCELEVKADARDWEVRVCPGYIVGPQGDEICIDDCVDVPLKTGAEKPACSVRWPCPPTGEMPGHGEGRRRVYVAVRYAECFTRPVRLHPAGCGCDENGCEYSRVRDSFEIKVLWELPASHTAAAADDAKWCELLRNTPAEELSRRHLYPVPPCPPCGDDPWVVLATVTIPAAASAATTTGQTLDISYRDRRVLLATQRVQVAVLCT